MNNNIEFAEIFEFVTLDNFDEKRYLDENPDIRQAVNDGNIKSGLHHFKSFGHREGRKQLKADIGPRILELRKQKSQRIEKILKPDAQITQRENLVFDFTNDQSREAFNFDNTENVSSHFYDNVPLDIINSLPEGLILDCGAGFRTVYYENVVNYEIVPYPTTDVVGFAEDLPFADNSFDGVLSIAVLEHIKYPFKAAEEMARVLKPGGRIAVCAAFLQPVHAHPHHYFNMTSAGLKVLFEDSIDIEKQFVNPGTGPMNSLSWFLRRWLSALPEKEQKKFKKMRVGDLLGKSHQYQDQPFVAAMAEKTEFDLASATLLVGRKK